MIFAAENSPSKTTSNLSAWAEYFDFVKVSPEWLKSGSADTLIMWLGFIILLVVFGLASWAWLTKGASIPYVNFQIPGRISWDFTGNFISLSSSRHSIGTSGDMMLYGDVEYRINQFLAIGKNNSNKPIKNVKGYIRSNKTNRTIPILLDGMPPEQTHGIPGKCEFWVRAIFPKSTPPKEGYTIEDFWMHFGGFTFVFEYDTKKYEKSFSKKTIECLIGKLKDEANNSLIPKESPRVVPREDK